jgi:APA family basic amino acid/polyamine antiporter
MGKTDPDARRPIRVMFLRVTPHFGILFSLLLMFSLPAANWLRLPAWPAVGLVFGSVSGSRHSSLSPNALSPERIYASLIGHSHALGR